MGNIAPSTSRIDPHQPMLDMMPRAILDGLNQEQLEAVTMTDGPVLIIAGAGTGKTTVVTRRIAYLVEQGLARPDQILALTFTDKAALEMEERVDIMLPMGYLDTWIMTFHAFGDRLLRQHALEMGLSPNFKVMGRAEQLLFLQQHLFTLGLDYYRPLSSPTKFLEALTTFISRCKDEDIAPADYQRYVDGLNKGEAFEGRRPTYVPDDTRGQESDHSSTAPTTASSAEQPGSRSAAGKQSTGEMDADYVARQQELATAYAKYEELKSEANVMDFGDQVTRTIQLLRDRPDVLKHYQQQFKYILVDEYQDTNFSQNQLVQLLAGGHGNICVVGDDDQSIYKFRGAAISNILQFQQHFPDARQIVLTQNYRSTQSILDSAYKLIRHNDPDRLEVANGIDKRLVAPVKTGGAEPVELFGQTLSEEADAVVESIQSLMAEQQYRYQDFAVLVRANAQADPFIQALSLRGIPSTFSGASGLYEQPEVKMLLSFLQALTSRQDSISLYHLASSDLYQVPMVDLVAVMDAVAIRHQSLHWGLDHLDELGSQLGLTEDGLSLLKTLRQDLQELLEASRSTDVGRVLYQLLDRREYLQRLEREAQHPSVTGSQAQTAIANISAFFDRIEQFYRISDHRSVKAYIDYIRLMREAGDDPNTAITPSEVDAVKVLTVHAAKGLEFPVVYLVNLVTERFPSRSRSDSIALPEALIKEQLPSGDFHLQEERRLFYVGMTRAKDRLFLTWGRDYGGRKERKVSPFVMEALGRPSMVPMATKSSAIERINRFAGQLPLLPVPTDPLNLSGVQLTPYKVDDYESCPLKYYYGNELKLPTPPHHALGYGSAIHTAVEQFYRLKMRDETMMLADLLHVYEDSWDDRGFVSKEHEQERFQHGKLVLEDFWQREKDSLHRPRLLEQDFTVKLDGVVVKGRWDRVDQDADGNETIIDYKTSERMDQKSADTRAKQSIQLKVYTLAYVQRYKKLPARVGLLYLDGNIFGSFTPDQQTLQDASQHILAVASGIKSKEFSPTPSTRVCGMCQFRSICPYAEK